MTYLMSITLSTLPGFRGHWLPALAASTVQHLRGGCSVQRSIRKMSIVNLRRIWAWHEAIFRPITVATYPLPTCANESPTLSILGNQVAC